MFSTILTIVVGLIGIIGTVVAYKFNPKNKVYDELDGIYVKLDKLYIERDTALQKNDSNALTIAVSSIKQLSDRKAVLLQRLGKNIH